VSFVFRIVKNVSKISSRVPERILITGSTGFIGSHFAELMRKDSKYEVVPFIGDITRKTDIVRNLRDIDTVANFAALTYLPPSWDSPGAYANVNYLGVVNLLENHSMFKRFVQISTSHVYGNQTKFPISLENVPNPQDPYSIAKFAAEKAVEAYADKYGFDYLIVRPFNNFGPRQSKDFVIPTFCLQACKNQKIVVRGDTKREFLFVRDTVQILKNMLDDERRGLCQISKGETYRISTIAQIIASLTNATVEIAESDRQPDIEKLLGVPFDFPFTDMKEALSLTLDYYRGRA